jgi:uncharacterized repeat protein (TIGR01451 family)
MKKLIISLILLYLTCFCLIPAFGYYTHNTTISRAFDKEYAVVGESITVTVSFVNLEVNDMRGLYYTEQIPLGLSISTVSVKINGSNLSYAAESGVSGGVYTDYTPYRWILELPPSFEENNPVSQGSIVEIVYTITSSNAGAFGFNEFNWVGYYQTSSEGERAAFGYSEAEDKHALTFLDTLDFDYDNDGDVDGSDLYTFASDLNGNVVDLAAFSEVFGR